MQRRLRDALDQGDGPLRLISMCAEQGRDVIPVLADHPRGDAIDALLVELDPRNAAEAEAAARDSGLARVRVLVADAAETANYRGAVPADVILACGIFGNISDDDIHATVAALPALAAPGATVIWTRGRWANNDPTPRIRSWFREAGFEELSFDAPDDCPYSVGVNRLASPPLPFDPTLRLFRFLR